MTDRVLIVDDHEKWRQWTGRALRNHPRWTIVAEAENGLEAVEKAAKFRPDVIVLDISLPELDGIEAARRILAANPQSKILFYSVHRLLSVVEAALRTGARGYLLKSDGRSLLAALEAVSAGALFISEGLTDVSEE
jgi:DNA-binding NarL/FixJ family response regulator